MNILRAEAFVSQYGSSHQRLNELYHDDEMLQAALQTLFPDFELEKYAHYALGEVIALYKGNPLPLTP
ncbi:hypothetical protein WJ97_11275 [Burkholderia ubonensis]|uniref:hypothetical protein n=1 Tax=Burkholderia ubonensis TaxID=101571 RepID=UPI000753FB26|nr:hypothetical protein [Burkholderia ubonensis]KVP96463.1 hypothetical protein WJ97_11275 [Burkholderia ubonensis]